MKIYMASRFSNRHILQGWQDDLIALGHEIVSRWSLRGNDHQIPTGLSRQASDDERARFAVEDIEDINRCDCMISLMCEPRNNSRGGRHVEFGYALAKGCRLITVGPRETVFHHLETVEHFNDWASALNSGALATDEDIQND